MQERYFRLLERIAIDNPGTKKYVKMAAGIVYKGRLIATGINSYKTHPLMLKYGKNADSIYLHSEIDAIRNASRLLDKKEFKRCDLYIMRVHQVPVGHNDHMWVRALAKPCKGCQEAIKDYGFANVYWTDSYCGLESQLCMAA